MINILEANRVCTYVIKRHVRVTNKVHEMSVLMKALYTQCLKFFGGSDAYAYASLTLSSLLAM